MSSVPQLCKCVMTGASVVRQPPLPYLTPSNNNNSDRSLGGLSGLLHFLC